MATVNLGRIKFVWQGAYNGATAYVADDVVSYNGSSYICILASTGNLPTNTTYWNQMSQAGTNGTNGTDVGTVITTQGDLLYRDASGLQRLGAGTSGQFLKTNGAGANPQWSTVTTNLNDTAWLEYTTTSGEFRSLEHYTGITSGERVVTPFNTVTDPYNILGTIGSNTFRVNSSGVYLVSISVQIHTMAHYKLYLYDSTNNKYAPRPNSTWNGEDTYQAPLVSYGQNQGSNHNIDDFYYLSTGIDYSSRYSNDGTIAGFATSSAYLYGNTSLNGINTRNTTHRTTLTKMSGI